MSKRLPSPARVHIGTYALIWLEPVFLDVARDRRHIVCAAALSSGTRGRTRQRVDRPKWRRSRRRSGIVGSVETSDEIGDGDDASLRHGKIGGGADEHGPRACTLISDASIWVSGRRRL